MKRQVTFLAAAAFACGTFALAQTPTTQPTGQKTLAATMNV
jgi:hypothetical protein